MNYTYSIAEAAFPKLRNHLSPNDSMVEISIPRFTSVQKNSNDKFRGLKNLYFKNSKGNSCQSTEEGEKLAIVDAIVDVCYQCSQKRSDVRLRYTHPHVGGHKIRTYQILATMRIEQAE